MNKKVYILAVFFMFIGILLSQKCYAKYVMNGNLGLNVYIDRTPPVIHLTSKGEKESFPTTDLDNIIKRTDDVTIDTTDNIAIKDNEYYYNPTDPNFDDVTPEKFEDGKKISDEGYYKIKATDTFGNETEIIILLDKSAPNVTVRFFKKNQISSLKNELFEIGGAIC